MENKSKTTSEKNDGGGVEIKKQANEAVGQVKEKAAGILDDQKSKITGGLTDAADSIRKIGENLRDADKQNTFAQTTARYGETVARKIEGLSGYLENADFKDLKNDVEKFARRQPTLFVGGAFLLGVLAARFLKTSAPKNNSTR